VAAMMQPFATGLQQLAASNNNKDYCYDNNDICQQATGETCEYFFCRRLARLMRTKTQLGMKTSLKSAASSWGIQPVQHVLSTTAATHTMY